MPDDFDVMRHATSGVGGSRGRAHYSVTWLCWIESSEITNVFSFCTSRSNTVLSARACAYAWIYSFWFTFTFAFAFGIAIRIPNRICCLPDVAVMQIGFDADQVVCLCVCVCVTATVVTLWVFSLSLPLSLSELSSAESRVESSWNFL